MASLSSLISNHIPNTGVGQIVLHTNQEELILRNAVLINGKRYDAYIQLFDQENQPIYIDENSKFLPETLKRVSEITQELFQNRFSYRPELAMISVSKNHPKCCFLTNKASMDQSEKIEHGKKDEYNYIIDHMQAILEVLSPERQVVWSMDGQSQSIKPKVVPLVRQSFDEPIPSKNKVQNQKKPSQTNNSFIAKSLPRSLVNEQPESPLALQPRDLLKDGSDQTINLQTLETEQGQKHITRVEEEFDKILKAQSADAFPTFLRGVSYSELKKYSNDKLDSDRPEKYEKLEKPFEVFKRVLGKPDATGDDQVAMKRWINLLYLKSLEIHQTLRDVYNDDIVKGETRGFDEWCQHYAAKSVVGFVRSDLEIGQIVKALNSGSFRS